MLNRIIKFSIQNKMVIGMMTIILIIWGVWSVTKLPIDAVPDITNNQVQIITSSPTMAGQEIEQLVTFPIEQSMATLQDLEETRSISRFGLSVVTLVFKEDVDIYFARQLINERLKVAEEHIPKGLGKPELAPVSTGLGEVYQYLIHPKKGSEHKYNAKDLRTFQDWIVARQLYGIEGVAEVNSFGGELKQYEVAIDPHRLKSMGVSITDVFNALEQNNQNTGGAYIDKKPNAYFIRGIGLATSLEDIRQIAVKSGLNEIPVFIRDVATVKYGTAIRYGALTYNGEVDAVGGIVMMLKGANSNEVVKKVKERIPIIQKTLPEDIIIEPYLDRTELVGRAMSTVERNLIEGALIVIFVLVLFLGNLRAGLIVASAIPLSLLFALGMMNVFGVSANLMSLGAIDFGLIVDGAVIIVEATLHHLGLRKTNHVLSQKEMDDEVFHSASKIRSSAAFGEIIILIVYIPILTLVGVEGKMFTPMAKTVSFAILGALILSMTYIPMMSALFLSKKPQTKVSFSDRMMEKLARIYQPILAKALRIKYLIVGVTVAIFAFSLVLFNRMGGEFIPQLQEGDFAFHCILPQGSSLSQSVETSMQASRIVREFEEVKMVVGKTGTAEVPTDLMPSEATDMMIILKPMDEWESGRSYNELAEAMIEKLEVIPGVFFEINQPIQMRFNELMTGVRQDVAVKIFGENLDSLSKYGEQVGALVSTVAGASSPQVEQIQGLPQINVEYDRVKLANYGLNVVEVNDVLSTAFAGKVAGQIFENERRFDLVVRLDSAYRGNIEQVQQLLIPLENGEQIPLVQVADVAYKQGPAQISREEGKRRIVVGFNVSGRDVQSVVKDIQGRLTQEVKLPEGYYFTYGGQFENLQQATNRLLLAVPVSLFLILVLLYFTFHSMKQAILIFTAIPMSAIGGIFALIIRGMPFSISAGIGFIALFGVAVLNGIVLIGTFNDLKKQGEEDIFRRIMEGTKIRLRPVLMTATVASLGFLPMAISTGAGAEVQKPLATVVIGGLITATLLTLFVLPMLYLIFSKKGKGRPGKTLSAGLVLFFLFSIGINKSEAQVRIQHVEDAIKLAEANNRNLKAMNKQVESSMAIEKSAFELPKLDVSAQLGQYNSPKFDHAFQLSQSIPFPTLFSSKRALFKAETRERIIQSEMNALEIKKQVRSSYYLIRYLQENDAELKKVDRIYQDVVSIAGIRYQAGDTKKVDVTTVEAKRAEIKMLLDQNAVYLNQAYEDLRALLNSDEQLFIDSTNYQPLAISNMLDSSMIKNHPRLQQLAQQVIIASEKIKVERSGNLPEFNIGYTNQSLIGTHTVNGQEQYFGAGKRFNFVNVGISIPLTSHANAARIKSYELDQQSLQLRAEQEERNMRKELDNAIFQYQQYLIQHAYFENKGLPNAEEIVQAAQLGYKSGDIGYVEYLYAIETSINIHLNYLKTIQELNQTVILIQSLLNK